MMPPPSDPPPSGGISYRDSGVDIEAGNRLVDRIKPAARSTFRPEVLTGLGGFGALFELPQGRYRQPVLVSGTDGVGTKLKLAQQLGEHRTIGIDLVAMCANDILVQGAEPLFFLDYFATGRLNVDLATTVIEGIAEGCRQAGAALIGGESAEMPGMYTGEDYDLAGFCVGVVERDRILDGSAVRVGDRLVGIASTGPHSNGYSLIRRILERPGTDPAQPLGDTTVGQALLAPTHIYVSVLRPLLTQGRVHALAHITGGGITENLPRILGAGQAAEIHTHAWPRPPVFEWIRSQGGVAEDEMLRTFNCGIGMIAVVGPDEVAPVMSHCRDGGVHAWDIGEITSAGDGQTAVSYI